MELDSRFREVMQEGGSAARLVQTFTTNGTHSFISDPTYPALMDALLQWVNNGTKPTPSGIASACLALEATYGKGCSFDASYTSPALATRVAARQRPQ